MIKKALIVDTDAHQGNGFANVVRETGWAHVVDLFDESIYLHGWTSSHAINLTACDRLLMA